MELNLGQWVVIVVSAILIAGYIRGYYYNRQRAERVYRWLRNGLSSWGEVRIGGRLGAWVTGGRIEVRKAGKPIQHAEVIFVLEPRENLIFLFFNRLTGKRDELIIRVTLRTSPAVEIEAGRENDRELIKTVAASEKKAFSTMDAPQGFTIMTYGKDESSIGYFRKYMESFSSSILRISLRRNPPHLILRAKLPTLLENSTGEFFNNTKDFINQLALKKK